MNLQIIPSRQGVGIRERFIGRLLKRRRHTDTSGWNWVNFIPIPDSIDGFWLIIAFILIAVMFTLIGWPLLLVLADFIWLILVLLGAVVSFIVLRRPITITAKHEDIVYTWKVRGLNNSRKKKAEILQQIAHGTLHAPAV